MVAKYRPLGNCYFKAVITLVVFVGRAVRYLVTWDDKDSKDRLKAERDLDVRQRLQLVERGEGGSIPCAKRLLLFKARALLQKKVLREMKAAEAAEPPVPSTGKASRAASKAAPRAGASHGGAAQEQGLQVSSIQAAIASVTRFRFFKPIPQRPSFDPTRFRFHDRSHSRRGARVGPPRGRRPT